MNIEEFKELMRSYGKKIEIQFDDKQLNQFYDYMNLLLEWNEKINLTAITEVDDVILKHFIDSMTVLNYIKGNENIIDVGTGAGFPGIPIAILKQNKITLLDSLNKRILFLNDVIEKIDLKNVITIHSRVEEFGQNRMNREKYDISISRAVANLATLVEYLLPLVKIGGRCICMKGSEIDDEIKNAKYAIKELGGEIEKIDKMILPGSDIVRNIIVIRKVKETSKKYPRKAGTPSKMPLTK